MNRFCAAVLVVSITSIGIAQQTGSWGDQGDGTYKNPILNADYPDVDVEQVGDTYYMISSKQHMCPGMVILESKDMVNWQTLGHVWERLDWAPEYNWDQMNGYPFGVWAGDLAYHDGTWYCYQVDARHGLFMSSAPDIRGPWSKPIPMLSTEKVLDDPAVFWDDDAHQAYLICNNSNKLRTPNNKKPGNENRLYKMSWDGKRLEDEGTLMYTGPGAEAAKIYKISGIWYIFLAEWNRGGRYDTGDATADKGDRKQIVLRSKTNSIYGPYDRKVVMERGNGIIRSCSQGGLMQAPDGSWWYTHQLIQNIETPFQGRPQCLEPVTWIDNWPIIGKDIDGDGVGEPVLQHRKPIQGFPITAPASDDRFGGDTLGRQWEWNHNPRMSHWSLTERPGWLRLKASQPIPKQQYRGKKKNAQVFWRACNTVSQRIMGTTTGTAVAKFDLAGMKPGQQAGFVRFGGVFNLLGVEVDIAGTRRLFYMGPDGAMDPGPEVSSLILYVKTSNQGNQAQYSYSFDGQRFQRFGPEFTLAFGLWTGDRLGFFCWNEKQEEGHLDVDWFTYNYDGPKSVGADLKNPTRKEELLLLDNGTIKIGINRPMGASITWLSWNDYPKNMVNSSDPGRLIQQSYYAGKRLDRKADGQSHSWSPWTWNPIQGGGVSSWARVSAFKRIGDHTLYAETVPKLWDMPNEEAAALMRQWTRFETGMANVVVVRCELVCQRSKNDRWGPAALRPQEVPACYFTRNFNTVKSYLGDGQWRVETQPPGPPWGTARPPRKAMALFNAEGQGVAVFSPIATQHWNYGPHAGGLSEDPAAGPCMHVAPIDRVHLGPKSTYRYRYWIAVGDEAKLATCLEALWKKYAAEQAELINP